MEEIKCGCFDSKRTYPANFEILFPYKEDNVSLMSYSLLVIHWSDILNANASSNFIKCLVKKTINDNLTIIFISGGNIEENQDFKVALQNNIKCNNAKVNIYNMHGMPEGFKPEEFFPEYIQNLNDSNSILDPNEFYTKVFAKNELIIIFEILLQVTLIKYKSKELTRRFQTLSIQKEIDKTFWRPFFNGLNVTGIELNQLFSGYEIENKCANKLKDWYDDGSENNLALDFDCFNEYINQWKMNISLNE